MSNPGNRAPELDIDEGADSTDDGDEPDSDEAQRLQQEALALEEQSDIERLLGMLRRLPPDSKLERLRNTISDLRAAGYGQVMVFTQFTDTMDFLRGQVGLGTDLRIMCFSGRGGEIMSTDGSWRTIPRDDVKRRFRDGDADILLCTEAAAEGLNFQFRGSFVNYDMPGIPCALNSVSDALTASVNAIPKFELSTSTMPIRSRPTCMWRCGSGSVYSRMLSEDCSRSWHASNTDFGTRS